MANTIGFGVVTATVPSFCMLIASLIFMNVEVPRKLEAMCQNFAAGLVTYIRSLNAHNFCLYLLPNAVICILWSVTWSYSDRAISSNGYCER